jgi:hypothetical protein
MKSLFGSAAISLFVFMAFSAGQSRADITDWGCNNPTDWASSLQLTKWTNNGAAGCDMSIAGSQYAAGAQFDATFTTDSPTDPTITLDDSVTNSTGYDWTSYDLAILMPNPFTVSGIQVNIPNTWSSIIGAQFINNNYFNDYETDITLTGLPSIDPGDTLDFQYLVSFSGQTSYQFIEQLSPVPEPAGLGLLTAVLTIALGGSRRFLRPRSES